MLANILLIVSALSIIGLLYPYIIYPMILKYLPSEDLMAEGNLSKEPLNVALLLCAYNESESLPSKLENINDIKKLIPDLKVYAYSDCSDDGTNEILSNSTYIDKFIAGIERIGKVKGMQVLVNASNEDLLIFTDANVMIKPNTITNLIKYFSDQTIGSVAGTLYYSNESDYNPSAISQVGGLYWRLEESIKEQETRSGSMMGADGAIFARRRDNYPNIPAHLVDDMAVSLSVLNRGQRCISAKDVIAHEPTVTESKEEFKRKRRIACGSYSTYVYMKPDIKKMSYINRFKFVSHKLLRWYGAYLLIISIISALLALFILGKTMAIFGLLTLIGLFFVGGYLGVPIISNIYEIVLSIIATGIGVSESLLGRKYETWNPAKSRNL